MDLPLRLRLKLFYDDYAHVLDSDQLEKWPEFFTEQARYRVTSRENYERNLEHATLYCEGKGMLRDRVAAIRKSTVFEPRRLHHLVGGVQVASASEEIAAEATFAVFESLANRESRLFLIGSYVDRLVVAGDGFLFRDRTCVYDDARISNSLIFPV